MFIYLTTWVVILESITFFTIVFRLVHKHYSNLLIIVSWTMGWFVFFLFWFYIYPQIREKDTIPLWAHVLSHGIIHFFIVVVFFKADLEIKYKYYALPVVFTLVYVFVLVLPLKIWYNVTVYPKFFEEFGPTVVYIVGALCLSGIFFGFGRVLHADLEEKHKVR